MNNAEHLERVSSRIRQAILDFAATHDKFHMEELREFVAARTQGHIAPASPDRVLRQLRKEGVLDYRVLSRRQSLYSFIGQGVLQL